MTSSASNSNVIFLIMNFTLEIELSYNLIEIKRFST